MRQASRFERGQKSAKETASDEGANYAYEEISLAPDLDADGFAAEIGEISKGTLQDAYTRLCSNVGQ